LLAPACCAVVVASCGSGVSKPGARLGHPIQVVGAGHAPTPLAGRSPVAHPPPLAQSEPAASRGALGAARQAALRFFPGYVRFVYGRVPADKLLDVSAQLRAELSERTDLVTPAEQAAKPQILRLSVAASGPPVSVTAIADVAAGGGSYELAATLEPTHGRWTIVAVDG
jgi:hypothetical protein